MPRNVQVTAKDVEALRELMGYADDYQSDTIASLLDRMEAVLPKPRVGKREAALASQLHKLMGELSRAQEAYSSLYVQYEALKRDKRPRFASIRCPDCRKTHRSAPPIAEESR